MNKDFIGNIARVVDSSRPIFHITDEMYAAFAEHIRETANEIYDRDLPVHEDDVEFVFDVDGKEVIMNLSYYGYADFSRYSPGDYYNPPSGGDVEKANLREASLDVGNPHWPEEDDEYVDSDFSLAKLNAFLK